MAGNQGTGSYWSIPYIHTAMRMDRDKSDQVCARPIWRPGSARSGIAAQSGRAVWEWPLSALLDGEGDGP